MLLFSTMVYVVALSPSEYNLEAVISPDPVTVDAGAVKALSVALTLDGNPLATDDDNVQLLWSVNTASLGVFDRRAVGHVNFTAGMVGGTGIITCKVTYNVTTEVTAEVVLTVNPPTLDAVIIDPSTKTLMLNEGYAFSATALSSVGTAITSGITFSWTVSGLDTSQYTLNATTGSSVVFTALVMGEALLTAQTTYLSLTRNGSANITVLATMPIRAVDYRYYDFFEVPFGEWWDLRWDTYHEEQVISYTYPTMFYWYSQPPGNIWVYSNMMLDVEGRNMTEINMNSWPEFLPLLGTARGGNAEIDWFMQYLTQVEMERYPGATSAWADGWVISLNGTTTMDKQAAMAVLGVTSAGFDDFATWWSANERDVEDAYSAWLLNEGNRRLDIYNMYEYPLTPLTFDLTAQKVADKIVLSYDIISWGMEAMMTRWLHEAFMPTEHYFENFNMHASIGPETTNVSISTAVAYGIYAYETTVVPVGKTHGDPCWVWRTNHQDYVKPSIGHPKSDFAPYVYNPAPGTPGHKFTYANTAPGSLWYGQQMPYDHAPTAHNLSVNETLVIEFPTGPQLFKEQAFYPNGTPVLDKPDVNQRIVNTTANMTLNYSAPMASDNPELSPGSVSVDNVAGRLTYTGPIDMWTWSKDQTNHQFLSDEWDRLGIIPYGIPYVELTLDRGPQPPIADAGFNQVVYVGDLVTFDGSSSQGDEQIVNYTWEFLYNGSLRQLYGVSPTFEFWTEGLYNVTLTVRDTSNQTGSAVVQIIVMAEIPEFPIVLVPVAGVLIIFLLAGISRHGGRPKRESHQHMRPKH
jgi:hypothetical protein